MMNQSSKGINFYAYFEEHSGLSESARLNIRAIKGVQVPVRVFNYSIDNKPLKNSKYLPSRYFNEESVFAVNLIHINLNFIEDFIVNVDTDIFKNKYNIAYWAWEFSETPQEILPFLDFFDEIWMPSYFCVNAFSKVSKIPILKFSHPIIPRNIEITKNELKLPENKFIILTIFDSISSLERKNPFAVIDAFEKAFGKDNEEVILVVKTANFDKFELQFKKFNDRISTFKNILLINEFIDEKELFGLIKHCDAFLSLHRSEGFGLTMAEAMAYEKPVIATGFSGNLDFMNTNNSFLVDYELIKTEKDYGLTKKGFTFANPDTNHAAALLKKVFTNSKIRIEKAKNAKRDIELFFSSNAIGNQMKDRISLIYNSINSGTNENNSKIEIQVLKQKNSVLDERVNYLENTIYNKLRKKIKSLKKKR